MAAARRIDPPLAALAAPRNLFLGTSGWAYPAWKPAFYPEGLPPRRFLSYYASRLNSVEINYTFRSLPSVTAVAEWLGNTPEGFRFSFKAPQRITHFQRLRECGALVQDFLTALEPVRLAGKLGLVLFQLPPNFHADVALLGTFLANPALRGTPIAFEFRHVSWFQTAVYDRLQRANAALCIAETEEFVTPEVHTAETFTCFRLRRSGGYSQAGIEAFANRFALLAGQRTVYAYLKHEDEPTGALNALSLFAALAGASGC